MNRRSALKNICSLPLLFLGGKTHVGSDRPGFNQCFNVDTGGSWYFPNTNNLKDCKFIGGNKAPLPACGSINNNGGSINFGSSK